MIKGILLGLFLGVAGVAATVYLYFATGQAPVAVRAPEMPFERKFAHLGMNAYLDKLPHPKPQVAADEENLMRGAKVYRDYCAVCHGLPDSERSAIADGMAPRPPQFFRSPGGSDDEPWENYWKVENGIRMTGMPGFKGRLTETQIWQVAVLLKNAGNMTPAVKQQLAGASAAEAIPGTPLPQTEK